MLQRRRRRESQSPAGGSSSNNRKSASPRDSQELNGSSDGSISSSGGGCKKPQDYKKATTAVAPPVSLRYPQQQQQSLHRQDSLTGSTGIFSRWSPSQVANSRLGILLGRRGSMAAAVSSSSATASSLSKGNSNTATEGEDLIRNRSGSFHFSRRSTEMDNVLSPPERSFLARDRSLSDINCNGEIFNNPLGYRSLGRIRSSTNSSELSVELSEQELFGSSYASSSMEDMDLEEIQCLLPNGIIIDVFVHPDDELCQVKQVVLNSATTDERLPLRGCLNPDATHYAISFVNSSGRLEECCDERKSLRELKPFQNILKFAKRTKDKGHYQFKKHVGTLIGKNLNDFEELRNCEVNDFRWRMKVFANKIAQERKLKLNASLEAKIKYQYPPRIVSHPKDKTLWTTISVRLLWGDKEKTEVPAHITSSELISSLAAEYGHSEEYSRRCFIKIVGEDSFLVDNHRIIDYEYVRQRVVLGKKPKLIVINAETDVYIEHANEKIYQSLENDVYSLSKDVSTRNLSLTALSLNSVTSQQQLQATSTVNSFSVFERFSVTVESLELSPETVSVGVFRVMELQMGLFHGGRLLCPPHSLTFNSTPNDSGVVDVRQTCVFDISVSDIPRMTKLCVGVIERKKSQINPLFWVNTNLFDYRAKLKWKGTFHMWNYAPGDYMPTFQHLSPLRQSICNPNIMEAADLVLSFTNVENCSIEYRLCDITTTADKRSGDLVSDSASVGEMNNNAHVGTIAKYFTQELQRIADRDPLHDLTIQEKDLIWKIREYCLTKLPELLPRIIDCVDYTVPSQVAELASLLERWPFLKPEHALQLLDYAYPDENVRRFAVRCLSQAPDSVILCYLLQLAQALKHESYFHCELVEFLLGRALNNQHIGHYLFWELKAEMNSPSVGLLFGLILEAYLTAAPEHLRILEHQNTLLEKCRATQTNLQNLEVVSKSHVKAKNRFQASTKVQFDGNHPYLNFVSPLNPGLRCHKIKLEQCKLMNSKMRPQMLAFQNLDSDFQRGLGDDLEDVVVMYKKGDDLRQDRLTLQLLKVMDLIWKEADLDLRLSPYRCTSTDISEGFIEVVQRAETICRIQMAQADFKTTAVFRKGLLLAWLKSHNSGEEAMRQAQYEFTQSCAGYSVAMYILGIGDRHNDNIMVKTNGQLFHIDFGHFLGNFKHKFGIKRERVPMVLSSEFVEVIKADFGNKKNFERFRELCEKAFLVIRKHGSLIISLLAMMVSTGLPELSTTDDLNIIRATLHLERTEEDALDHFRKDFNESLRNAWTISLDWWFHMMNQVRPKGGGRG